MIQIFSTFEHTSNLELTISSLEKQGLKKESIYAVPLTTRKMDRKLFDTMHQSDGISLISTGAVLGTALAVVGASIGFKLKWGPIYWGLIGAVGGFLIGYLIDLYINKVVHKRHRLKHGSRADVILIVECEDNEADSVENTLWHFYALGIARTQC